MTNPPPKVELDKTGFPMVWVDSISAYLQWLPVTKIQAEYFLCSTLDSKFDQNWYEDLLYLNPRVTPKSIHDNNYWNAFLTGILPHEVQQLAQWYGSEYRVPTLDEWNQAYNVLKASSVMPDTPASMVKLSDRVQSLIEKVELAGQKVNSYEGRNRMQADQMLMRLGVMEWVECRDQRVRWGGMGKPARKLGVMFSPDQGQPHGLVEPETERANFYGVRLLRSR